MNMTPINKYIIDPLDESQMPLTKAAALPPCRTPKGKPCAIQTMYRWASAGVRGVKLPTLKTPRGTVTTPAAVAWFIARLNGGDAHQVVDDRVQDRHNRSVDRELALSGI